MSSSYISLAFTAIPETVATVDFDQALTDHFPAILAAVPQIDTNEYILNVLDWDQDAEDAEKATQEEGLRDLLREAWFWLKDEDSHLALPIGDTGRSLITAGGDTWGDSPFDAYDAVVILSDTAAEIPEFGAAIGVLGGGIRIP